MDISRRLCDKSGPSETPPEEPSMRFKRSLLAALTLLAAVLLGLPWWIGRDVESRFRELALQEGGPVRVVLDSFDGGWFASRARLRLAPAGERAADLFRSLGAPGADPALVLDTRVSHGLMPFRASGAHRWRPALAVGEGVLRTGDGRSAGAAIADVSYRVRPLGGVEVTIRSAGTRAGPDPVPPSFRLHASLPAGHGPARVNLAARRLALPLGGARLALRDLEADLDLDLPSTGLPTGTARLAVEALALVRRDEDRELARAERLAVKATFLQDGEKAGFRLDADLERVGSPREQYGPGRARFGVTDLDAASLARIGAGTARLAGRGMGERAMQMAVAGTLLAEAPRLLAHGPAAELESLVLQTPDGELTGRGRLALASADRVVLNNPFLLQKAWTGSLEFAIPPVAARHGALLYLRSHGMLADQGPPEAWLETQVARGRLTRDGDGYALSVRLSDGRLRVNGRPLPAP